MKGQTSVTQRVPGSPPLTSIRRNRPRAGQAAAGKNGDRYQTAEAEGRTGARASGWVSCGREAGRPFLFSQVTVLRPRSSHENPIREVTFFFENLGARSHQTHLLLSVMWTFYSRSCRSIDHAGVSVVEGLPWAALLLCSPSSTEGRGKCHCPRKHSLAPNGDEQSASFAVRCP